MSGFDYKAFITYSHADTKAATWLARSLESYRVPSRLVGRNNGRGIISRRVGSIFRDREELPAGGDLTQTLNAALANSEYLIVVCSPAARQSVWVDLEITEFKKTHTDDKILCCIVDGEPFAGKGPGGQQLECFPQALAFLGSDTEGKIAAEPIAADLREDGDGKRLTKLKIAAGLLGLGLDELIQRDGQRRQRNLLLLTLASATGMLVMAMLSFIAIDARNSEELRRAEAEDLIEFMLSDLRDRLDAVGRLDVLDAVGEKAIEYYSNVELAEHSESSLGRRARAFHLLGEVGDLRGDMQRARDAFDEAYQSTGELLAREANDGERIYNHAQSVFWVGYLDWRLGNYDQAEPAFQEYVALANRLVEIDSSNPNWVVETGHSNINLGVFRLSVGSPNNAIPYFESGREVFEKLSSENPEEADYLWLLGQAHGWNATANEYRGSYKQAREDRLTEVSIYSRLQNRDSDDKSVNLALLVSYSALAGISFTLGEIDVAKDTFFESKTYGDELLLLDAENTFVIHQLAIVYANLSLVLNFTDESAQAGQYLKQAEDMIRELRDKDGGVTEWNEEWYWIQNIRSQNLIRDGEIDQPIIMLQTTIEELQQLIEHSPDSRQILSLLARAQFYLGNAFEIIGNDEQATKQMESAVESYASITGELSLHMKASLGLAHEALGNSQQASAIAMELENSGFKHPEYIALESQ